MRVSTRDLHTFCTHAVAVFSLLLACSASQASDGRITFTGAIVSPTCATARHDVANLSDLSAHPHLQCPGTKADSARTPRNYTLTVRRLARTMVDRRVWTYFAHATALPGSGAISAKLVTQTYE